jgi:WS/DGAT/MGAT family acyltransferase
MDLLNASLDLRPDAPVLPTPSRRRLEPLPGPARSFATALIDTVQKRLDEAREAAALIEKPIAAAERLASTVNIAGRMMHMFSRRIAAAPWNARLVSNERSLAYLKIPFAELRTIRNVLGGTANDAVLAILGEAAARYMAHHNVHAGDYPIRIGCPVNVRREAEGGLGNRVSMMFPELSAAPMDAVARLRAVAATTMKLKMAREPQALDYLLAGAEMIPPPLIGAGSAISTTAAGAATKISTLLPAVRRILPLPAPAINFIATNVPGAQVPLYLAGRKMIDMIGCVPIAANLGYSVAIVSYNRNLIFGMMADPQLMPDLDRMRSYATEVFDELAKAARLAAPQKQDRVAKPGKAAQPPAV